MSKLSTDWAEKVAATKINAYIGLLLGTVAPAITLAQVGDLVQPLPQTTFDALRDEFRSEFYTEHSISFESPVFTSEPENNKVGLSVFLPTDRFGPVPVVILLHYWGASDDRLERQIAVRLAESGVASVLVPLPYHLSRTPSGKVSGEMAVVPDLGRLRATTTQAVLDVRRAIDWIETREEFRHDQIGLGGTSLGALVGALAFAVEPRIAASLYLLGGADMAHILWHSSRVVSQREELRKQGLTENRVREGLAEIEPLNYLRPDDRRPSFVIAAKFDTVVPPADAEKLIAALGNCQSLWLDTGHYGGALVQARLVRTVASYFSSTFRGAAFRAPTSLFAPTLRWGATLTGEEGLQVGAGIDVWRLKSDGETFATILLTPSGGQAFVGQTLSKNLALGFVVLPKRTTFGAFWSVVL